MQTLEHPVLALSNVTCGDGEVLSNFDLALEKGSFTILLGPSGSGKSTIVRLIAGEIQPSSGTFAANGSAISNLREHRRNLGLVSHDLILQEDRTVEESVELPLELAGVNAGRRRELVSATLDRFGLSDSKDRYPKALSMGERQRVMLARAVASEPFLLVADEPAAHLDQAAVDDIIRLIEREHLRGMTVLLCTSDADFAARFPKSTVIHLSRANKVT